MLTEPLDRPILPWRLVAGAWLHFIIPAYLIFLVIAFLVAGPSFHPADDAAHFAVVVSTRFVATYCALMIVSAVCARLLDPILRARRSRRTLRDPLARSRRSYRDVGTADARARDLLASDPRHPEVV
jgi:hypothetical protein